MKERSYWMQSVLEPETLREAVFEPACMPRWWFFVSASLPSVLVLLLVFVWL
jgi:hypothetical protein